VRSVDEHLSYSELEIGLHVGSWDPASLVRELVPLVRSDFAILSGISCSRRQSKKPESYCDVRPVFSPSIAMFNYVYEVYLLPSQLRTAISAIVPLSGVLHETEVCMLSSCSRVEVPLGILHSVITRH